MPVSTLCQPLELKVQIVIAVHNVNRPILRAAQSVLQNPRAGVIIVAHGLSKESLPLQNSEQIKVVECHEGAGYPGVPYNVGIQAATAPFVGIMGSDDWFEEGSIETMLKRAENDHSDIVIAPLLVDGFPRSYNPRTLNKKGLRAYKDRLFYRTAPLGIIRREILQNPRYAFLETVVTGDDLSPSVRLWTDGYKIASFPDDPAYVVGNDAVERVTTTPRPLETNFAFIEDAFNNLESLQSSLSPVELNALVIKLLRVHILAQTIDRIQKDNLNQADFRVARRTAQRVLSMSPRAIRSMSRFEIKLLRALSDDTLNQAQLTVKSADSLPFIFRRIPGVHEFFEHDSEIRQWLTVQVMKLRSSLSQIRPDVTNT